MKPLFLILILALGCTQNQSVRPAASYPKESLKLQLSAEPVSLDPALAEDGVSLKVINNVMDGLVGYDGKGQLRKRLASGYRVLKNGRRFEFTIRKGAKWSDGSAVSPEDFVRGIRQSLGPTTPSKLADLLLPIRGAKAYRRGKSKDLGVFTQNGKLVIELESPAPYFIHALTVPTAMPRQKEWNKGVGTGPYFLEKYEADQYLHLKTNPHYWGPRSKKGFSDVVFQIVHDESTAVTLFESGSLDILSRISSFDLERLRDRRQVITLPFHATYYLAFNVQKKPFDQRDWRRAVAGSIGKAEIVAALASGETVAQSWVPPGMEGYLSLEEKNPFEDSIKKVRKETEAGKQPSVQAVFSSDHRNTLVLQKVQQDILKKLGFMVELSNFDWKTFVRNLTADPPAFFRFGWLAAFADPISHLEVLTTGNPNNHTKWSNPNYDRLVSEIRSMKFGPARKKKIIQAQNIIVEQDAVVIPIYHYVQTFAVSRRVKSFTANPYGVIRFEELVKGE